MEKNSTDVIIEDKVYKISTDQDASYVRELAEYINEKMELLHRQSAYSKQANAFRQIILLMNMADDYCHMKQQAEEATRKYEQQEAEFYNMKREMVNMQMTIASLKKQLQEKPKTQAVCPYLQSLADPRTRCGLYPCKRDRGKKYTDRADITREKTISAVWIIRKQCSGTQEKINYRKARAVCRGFVL